MDVIREGMANGSALLIAGASGAILAWFTQWLNYKPDAARHHLPNNGNKTANSMENSMKTMNTVMPVFSAFMCLSFSIGIGIYWIAGALVRSVQQVIINRHMSSIDMDEVIRKNQEKLQRREKSRPPPQKITQAATQSVRNIQVQENEEPSAEEKEAARKASTEYYNSNQEYRAGSIAAKANMVKQFDEKNTKKK